METPLKRTVYDWILEGIAFVALLSAFYPLFFYGELRGVRLIPIHYNLAGEVDGWGGRSFLWVLSLVACVFYFGLTWMERNYKKFKFNYSFKITGNNAALVYRLGVRFMRHLKLLCMLLFTYINNSAYAQAAGKGDGLNKYVMMLFVGAIFVTIMTYNIKTLSIRK